MLPLSEQKRRELENMAKTLLQMEKQKQKERKISKFDLISSGAFLVEYIVGKNDEYAKVLQDLETNINNVINAFHQITGAGLNEPINENLIKGILATASLINGLRSYNKYLLSLVKNKIPHILKKLTDEVGQYDIEPESTPILNMNLLSEATKQIVQQFIGLGERIDKFINETSAIISSALDSIIQSGGMATPETKRNILKYIESLHFRKDAIKDLAEINKKINEIVNNSINPLLEGIEKGLQITENKKKEYITNTF